MLDELSRGRSRTLTKMYDLDSDAVRGGAAEMRSWIAVGAAMETVGAKATVVDYVPAHKAATGLAFAYWPVEAANGH